MKILKTLLSESPEQFPASPQALDAVMTKARRRVRRRAAGAAGLSLAVSGATTLLLIATFSGPSPRALSSEEPTHPGTIEGSGIRLGLPEGWEGRVEEPHPGVAFVAAGNIPMSEWDHEVPTHPRSGGDDLILMTIIEKTLNDRCEEYAPNFPPAIQRSDFIDRSGTSGDRPDHRLQEGHSQARDYFPAANRCFYVSAQFGTDPARDEALQELNRVLGSLEVEDAPVRPVPTASPPEGIEGGDEAWIVCEEAGADVRTPRVRLQADGLHVQVDNLAKWDWVYFEGEGWTASLGFDSNGESVSKFVVPVRHSPGEWRVACQQQSAGDPAGTGDIDPEDFSVIHVTDAE